MHEQELRKHRCCFTGHRPEKLNISEEQLCVRLGQEIDQAIEDGFTTFISGMAKGVDICAAELVLKRRVSDDRLKLICALPYENFGLHWSASWTSRYVEVIRHADMVRCISREFSYSAYHRRNDGRHLLDPCHRDHLIINIYIISHKCYSSFCLFIF